MSDTLEAGTILIEAGTPVPECLRLEIKSDSHGWHSVTNLNPRELDRNINQAGWIFFYLAEEIRTTVFGFDKQKTLQRALTRIITRVKTQNCNGLHINQVTSGSFWKLTCVKISAHSRHIQEGPSLWPSERREFVT